MLLDGLHDDLLFVGPPVVDTSTGEYESTQKKRSQTHVFLQSL